jgi:hypothetical protein
MLTKDFILIYYLKLALLCFTAHIIHKKEPNLHKWYILLKPNGDIMDGMEHIYYSEHQMHPHFTNYLRKHHYYCILFLSQSSQCGCTYIYGQNLIDT